MKLNVGKFMRMQFLRYLWEKDDVLITISIKI